jgi:hypothetical protein
MKRSIRLDEKLLEDAEKEGSGQMRSIASQVEYWASLGRAAVATSKPTTEDLNQLSKFNSNFMALIEKDVRSGEFRKELMKTGYAYEKSKMGPGYVDKIYRDGTRVTGKVVAGEFVSIDSNSAAHG